MQWKDTEPVRFSVTVCEVPGGMSLLTLPSSSVKLCNADPVFVIVIVTDPAFAVNAVGENAKSFAVRDSVLPDPPPPPLLPGGEGVIDDEPLLHAPSSNDATAATMSPLLTRSSLKNVRPG